MMQAIYLDFGKWLLGFSLVAIAYLVIVHRASSALRHRGKPRREND